MTQQHALEISEAAPPAAIGTQTSAVLEGGALALVGTLMENLGGETLRPEDLTVVKVPAGGGTTWEIPSLDGTDAAKVIEGVIVAFSDRRAYWPSAEPQQGTPPACSSDDGIYGRGEYGPESKQNPSGRCGTCPMAQFGTGKDGIGQACKARRLLFVLRPDDRLPIAVSAPAGSLANVRRYFVQLSTAGLPFYGLVTQLGLEKATSTGKQQYSQITLKAGPRLSAEQVAVMREYSDQFRPMVQGGAFEDAA